YILPHAPTILLSLSLPSSSNAPPHPEISTLSLHDALPISLCRGLAGRALDAWIIRPKPVLAVLAIHQRIAKPRHVTRGFPYLGRSEEHTSELQSRGHLVCRLLLEKKKNIDTEGARLDGTDI